MVKPQNARLSSTLCRSWCYTLHNPTDDEIDMLRALDPEKVVCHVFAHEICPTTGTPHLQGYVRFHNSCRLAWWNKQIPRIHVEKRRGTEIQAWEYCLKDGNVLHTVGEPSVTQVYSTAADELAAVIAEVEEGCSYVDIRSRHKAFVFNKRGQLFQFMKDHRRMENFQEDPFEEECKRDDEVREIHAERTRRYGV